MRVRRPHGGAAARRVGRRQRSRYGNETASHGIDPDAVPVVVEFASYHASPEGSIVTGRFLGADAARHLALEATDEERARKRAMLACFGSQRVTLEHLASDVERFRIAPAYDFTRPPHAGTLHYERSGWGTNGSEWRELAGSALAALGLRQPHLGGEVGLAEQEG